MVLIGIDDRRLVYIYRVRHIMIIHKKKKNEKNESMIE